jgi:DDE superfamily endonuclease
MRSWHVRQRSRKRKKKLAQAPDRYELHYQDETQVETNPYLAKQWQRIGTQRRIASVGVNRRVTVFGSKESRGRGRIEVVCGGQDSACFARYLAALDQWHAAAGREIFVVLDHASCHTSAASGRAPIERAAWLHLIWLAKYSPHLHEKEREWRSLKRDVRGGSPLGSMARDLRTFVDEIVDGLDRLGGDERLIIDTVPEWFLEGHRKAPTGRKAGRPVGAKDRRPRQSHTTRMNFPAPT